MKILFPKSTVVRTKHFIVAQDWEIPIPAFFIISSRRKISSIAEFNKLEAIEYIRLVTKVRQGMQSTLGIKVVYFFQNEDSNHGFHLWMFPRHPWMKKFGVKIESVRPIMRYALRTRTNKHAFDEVAESVQRMKAYLKAA